MINQRIVLLSPQPLFPNILNILFTSINQNQLLQQSQELPLPLSQQPNKRRNTRIKNSMPSLEPKRLPQQLLFLNIKQTPPKILAQN